MEIRVLDAIIVKQFFNYSFSWRKLNGALLLQQILCLIIDKEV